jgi:hypothetical protein
VATVIEWANVESILKEGVFDAETIIWLILFFLMQPSQDIIPSVQTLIKIKQKDEIIFNGEIIYLNNL